MDQATLTSNHVIASENAVFHPNHADSHTVTPNTQQDKANEQVDQGKVRLHPLLEDLPHDMEFEPGEIDAHKAHRARENALHAQHGGRGPGRHTGLRSNMHKLGNDVQGKTDTAAPPADSKPIPSTNALPTKATDVVSAERGGENALAEPSGTLRMQSPFGPSTPNNPKKPARQSSA